MGGLVYDSGWVPVPPAPGGGLLQFNNFVEGAVVPLTNALPVDFTWTIELQGTVNNGELGLLSNVQLGRCGTGVVVRPDSNPSPDDYWLRLTGEWLLVRTFNDNQEPINLIFLVRIEGEVAGLHFRPPASGDFKFFERITSETPYI